MWIRVLFLTIILSYSWQTTAQEPFKFGLYAGINGSQVSGDDLAGFNKFGVFGGLYTGQSIKDDLDWEFGLVYNQKGSYLGGDASRQYLLNLHYVEAPFSLRKYVKALWIEAGVSFGALLGFKETAFQSPVNDSRDFGKYEFAGFVGALYEFKPRLALLGRFSNSILPIREHRAGATYLWNLGQYNTVITMSLRYDLSR